MNRIECVEIADDLPALSFETGRIARQADGALVVRQGDTFILATVVAGRAVAGVDFVPLTVEYREKTAAVGRIPGNYQRRELRLGEHETLVSRLIDRALRPLFLPGYALETQVEVTVYSADARSDLTGLALTAAGGALWLSGLPVSQPVAGLRLARRGERSLPFADEAAADGADLDLVLAATPDGLVMVEGEADIAAEETLLAAISTGVDALAPVLDALARLAVQADVARPAQIVAPPPPDAVDDTVHALIVEAHGQPDARGRRAALAELQRELGLSAAALESARRHCIRSGVDANRRADGRSLDALRAVACEADILPANHGSALFTRGETQVIVSATLGGPRDGQDTESLAGSRHSRFLLHYNFPSFAVGEARANRGPGRRELGHGNLARRALTAVLPSKARYPFTLRVVSDVTESNGSSSMATVCGATIALVAAGVPLRAPVAGVALGAVRGAEGWHVLTDITGEEDHFGDLDFKVAGTAEGVTALQLDSKVGAVPAEVLAKALAAARAARLTLLEVMAPALVAVTEGGPRRIARTEISPGRVGALIGTGGRNLQNLQQKTRTRIEVLNDGQVFVLGQDVAGVQAALAEINGAAVDLRKGGLYRGLVMRVRDIGVFVRVGEHEALVHTSELGPASAPALAVGDAVVVRVLGADDRGRLRLSRRAALGAEDAILNA